ncbi:MAG: hypothetical protein RL071_3547, partial [Pseudomonadota bacterium]
MCADPGAGPPGRALRTLLWALPLAAAARLWAGLRQPAAIAPLSPAELKLLDPRAWDPPAVWPGPEALVALVADHANMHHGGYLAVQLLCWAVDGLLVALGIDLPLGALRLSGLLAGLALTAAWAWAAAGLRLGPALAGLALALPPLWATQGWSLAYGSHAEAGIFVALLVGARARGRALWACAAAGAAAGFDPLLLPALLLCAPGWWPRGRAGPAALALLAGAAPFTLPRLLAAGPRLWTLGVAEGPETRLPALLSGMVDPFQLGAALRGLGAAQLFPPGAWDGRGAGLSAALLGALGLAALLGAPPARARSAGWLLRALPVAHLLSLTLISPMRPQLQHRYLLPVLGAALLWPALAARRRGELGALAAALALILVGLQGALHLGLPAQGDAAARAAYLGRGPVPAWPWAAQRAGLEQLDPAGAPALAALAACRAGPAPDRQLAALDADPMWWGAVGATSPRFGTARLGEPGRPPQPAHDLPARLAGAGPDFHFGVGVGLAALEPV